MAYLQVHKKGYKRKGYNRRAFEITRHGKKIHIPATHVSPSEVSPSEYEIKDIGAKGRGAKLIDIERKGALIKEGYHTKYPAEKRHEALRRADKKYGTKAVFRMLQAQVVFRKRVHPETEKIFEEDRNWVEKNLLSKREARQLTAKARAERRRM